MTAGPRLVAGSNPSMATSVGARRSPRQLARRRSGASGRPPGRRGRPCIRPDNFPCGSQRRRCAKVSTRGAGAVQQACRVECGPRRPGVRGRALSGDGRFAASRSVRPMLTASPANLGRNSATVSASAYVGESTGHHGRHRRRTVPDPLPALRDRRPELRPATPSPGTTRWRLARPPPAQPRS